MNNNINKTGLLDLVEKSFNESDESRLNESISKGALKLDDKQIALVSFIFWLCYMAEVDLTKSIIGAWKMANTFYPLDDATKTVIKEKYNIDVGKLTDEYLREKAVFGEKINISEILFGETDLVLNLKDIKELRNDISHNRINDLVYKGESLFQKKTKIKLLMDYFRSNLNIHMSKSPIWSQLSEDEKKEIEENIKKYNNK